MLAVRQQRQLPFLPKSEFCSANELGCLDARRVGGMRERMREAARDAGGRLPAGSVHDGSGARTGQIRSKDTHSLPDHKEFWWDWS